MIFDFLDILGEMATHCIYYSIYLYIVYPPPCLQGTQGVFNPMPNSASLLGRRGSKILFFRGMHPPISNRSNSSKICFPFVFKVFSGPPFSSQRDRKGFPNGAPKCQTIKYVLKKVGCKSRSRNQVWKKEVPSVKIVLPAKF